MTHNNRPSKKLVPSLGNDRTCEHRFVDEDAMILEVDCSDCSGAQDIDNSKCASGITNILAAGIVPEAIVLKRFIHVRYRADRIDGLCESAQVLASLRRLETQPEELSDRMCRTCPANTHRLASDIIRRIRADPVIFRTTRQSISDEMTISLSVVRCPELARCVAKVVWAGSRPSGGS